MVLLGGLSIKVLLEFEIKIWPLLIHFHMQLPLKKYRLKECGLPWHLHQESYNSSVGENVLNSPIKRLKLQLCMNKSLHIYIPT